MAMGVLDSVDTSTPAFSAAAVLFGGNRSATLCDVSLRTPGGDDLVVDVHWSGVSAGTERLMWSGDMPVFPGLAYPLVPGYEAVGVVSEAADPSLIGRGAFVPGAHAFADARALFGAAASRLVSPSSRTVLLDGAPRAEDLLLALAATAWHAIDVGGAPDLIVGHGVLGRLAARLSLAMDRRPVVWEIAAERRTAEAYSVIDPATDQTTGYERILDLSGDAGALDQMVAHGARGCVITLAGFYAERPSFAFPPAFMKEAAFRIAAEWTPDDLAAVLSLRREGALSFDGLMTHSADPRDADAAYRTAFEDPSCLKMALDWRGSHDDAD